MTKMERILEVAHNVIECSKIAYEYDNDNGCDHNRNHAALMAVSA